MDTNPCSLPRDVRYKILLDLPLEELQNLCLANKKCAKIFNDDEFWRRRILKYYRVLIDRKPDYLTFKKFYKRIVNSGDLYRNDQLIAKNVMKAKNIINLNIHEEEDDGGNGGELFYLDIFDNFCVHGNDNNIYQYKYGDLILEQISNNENEYNSYLIMKDVQDFAITSNKTVFITHNKLYFTKNNENFTLVKNNINKIIRYDENSDFFLILSTDNILYTIDHYGKYEITEISNNIKTADFIDYHLDDKLNYIIFAVKNDNSLWCYTFKYKYKIAENLKPSQLNSFVLFRKIHSFQLFQSNVSKVKVDSSERLIILDLSGKAWILYFNNLPSFKMFSSITNENSKPTKNPLNLPSFKNYNFTSFASSQPFASSQHAYLITMNHDVYATIRFKPELKFVKPNVIDVINTDPFIWIKKLE